MIGLNLRKCPPSADAVGGHNRPDRRDGGDYSFDFYMETTKRPPWPRGRTSCKTGYDRHPEERATPPTPTTPRKRASRRMGHWPQWFRDGRKAPSSTRKRDKSAKLGHKYSGTNTLLRSAGFNNHPSSHAGSRDGLDASRAVDETAVGLHFEDRADSSLSARRREHQHPRWCCAGAEAALQPARLQVWQ